MSSTMTHVVFVLEDEDFLDRLREEDCAFADVEDHLREHQTFTLSAEGLDEQRLLSRLGVAWSQETEVEDMDGTVRLFDPDDAEALLSNLEEAFADPEAMTDRVAALLGGAGSAQRERMAEIFRSEEEAGSDVVESSTEAAAFLLVHLLCAVRLATDSGSWVACISYVD